MRLQASFDDGCRLDLRVAELLDKYEIPATFYLPAAWEKYNLREGRIPLSQEDAKHLASRFDIGSHSINHPMLTRISFEQAESEIRLSKQLLEGMFEREITSFCPPRGYLNEDLKMVVRKHYTTCRSTLVGNIFADKDPLWQRVSVHVAGKRRPEYKGTTWLKVAEKLWKQAQKQDKVRDDVVFSFFAHSWEIERYKAWGEFEGFLKMVTS